jgi:hypothetical protein
VAFFPTGLSGRQFNLNVSKRDLSDLVAAICQIGFEFILTTFLLNVALAFLLFARFLFISFRIAT